MISPVVTALKVVVCEDATEALRQDYLYRPPVFKPIAVDKVVVIRNGTQSGKPTVDFILVDETGQKYVFMMTGQLLRSLPLGDL